MSKEQVIEILANFLEVDPSEIHEDQTFEDLELDSLSAQEVMMEFEDALDGAELDVKQAGSTVRELIEYLGKQG